MQHRHNSWGVWSLNTMCHMKGKLEQIQKHVYPQECITCGLRHKGKTYNIKIEHFRLLSLFRWYWSFSHVCWCLKFQHTWEVLFSRITFLELLNLNLLTSGILLAEGLCCLSPTESFVVCVMSFSPWLYAVKCLNCVVAETHRTHKRKKLAFFQSGQLLLTLIFLLKVMK